MISGAMDAQTFKRLFVPCSRSMYVAAWRLTGNAQEAEDMVQETLLKLWTKRDRLADVSNAEAYSVAALRNVFYDRHRIRHIETEGRAEDAACVADGADVAVQTERADEGLVLRRLIDGLPDNQRRIMTMRDLDGMEYDEIERLTGLSAANVRTLLSRARKSVREQFKKIMNYGCK